MSGDFPGDSIESRSKDMGLTLTEKIIKAHIIDGESLDGREAVSAVRFSLLPDVIEYYHRIISW